MKRPIEFRKIITMLFIIGVGLTLFPARSIGAGDTNVGDTEIYGSATAVYQPNVLFVIDDSGSMKQAPPNAPADYDPSVSYGNQTVCSASLKNGNQGTAYASLGSIGGGLLVPPPVLESSSRENGKTSSVAMVKSNLGEKVSATAEAVKAVWNGVAPQFLRVAQTKKITGTVTLANGNGISGVTVTATGSCGTFTATTGSSGAYQIQNVTDNCSYTVTFSLSGYSFSPGSLTVTVNGNNVNNTDSTGTPLTSNTYRIRGNIKDSGGNNLIGVTVTATGINGTTGVYSDTTNINGNFSVLNVPNGQYTLTPVLNGYTFNPVTITVTVNGADNTGNNFTATGTSSSGTYTISGHISTSGGTAVSGVTVTAVDQSGSTYTDVTNFNGNYIILNVPSATYTVTPSKAGYSFSPGNLSVTINNGNSASNNFTANGSGGNVYSISGTITKSSGSAASGVTVTITGPTGTSTATTDSQGQYVFNNLAGGGSTYTVTPSQSGYTFTPSSSSVTINSSNKIADFTRNSGGGGGGGGGGTISCASNTIYKYTANGGSTGTYNTWGNLTNGIATNCPAAYTALTTTGIWVGTLNSINGACTSSDQAGTFFLGNWMNWANQTVTTATGTSKMQIAKNVVTNLMLNTKNVRMGMMVFDQQNKGGVFTDANGVPTFGGNTYNTYVDYTTTGNYNGTDNLHNLIHAVNSLSASTFTPLAGTLYEAMLYFMGNTSFVHPALTYTSPIQAGCQTNYVIIITDGMSTSDQAVVTGAYPNANGNFGAYCLNGDCDGDEAGNNHELSILGIDAGSGSDYLDDVALYMHTHDMISTMSGSKVTIYTVGFALDPADLQDLQGITLLNETATNGGGQFVNVKDSATLTTTLSTILGSILQINTSFVAPVVPVSPANRTYSGSSLYLGLFLPQSNGFWYGNLKKFGYLPTKGVVDVTGNPATSLTGAFNSTAQSFWSAVQDGGLVKEGGTGAVLLKQGPQNRYLYTYTGTSNFLTSSSNAFTIGNSALTPAKLGINTGAALTDATNFTNTINYVYGYNLGANTERTWIMGDILHSEPAVVNYASNLSVIYVGGNDGMLHAFVDANPDNCGTPVNTTCASIPSSPTLPAGVTDGGELWGFIPPEVLPNLQNLWSPTHGYGVDGSPAVYYYDANGNGSISPTDCKTVNSTQVCDQVLLVFGDRRGGGAYWAFDVTDPLHPSVAWHVDKTTAGFSELGESFSKPQIGPVNIGGTTTQTVFVSGGYDNTNEDQNINPTFTHTDTSGRGIYGIDLKTGALIWSYTYAASSSSTASYIGDPNMKYSIPSDIATLDLNNNVGLIDTLYVGDVGGEIWKFDLSNSSTSSWTGKILFTSNPGSDASVGRKIFYPPDITFESGYQALFFGTGDREHPRSNTTSSPVPVDRIYALYDKPTYTGSALEGGTAIGSCSVAAPALLDVTSNSNPTINCAGWYIRLNDFNDPAWSLSNPTGYSTTIGKGEKMLAAPLVLNKVATFTTYAPLDGSTVSNSSCGVSLGTAFVWSLNYTTGGAVFDYNVDGSKTLADRSQALGSGIPSEVVMVTSPTGVNFLAGVGGGVPPVTAPTTPTITPLYWHQPY